MMALSTVLCGAGCKNVASGTAEPPKVGDVVMKDGTFKKVSEVTVTEVNDTIAVVYKVSGGKAWAVGKKKNEKKMWCQSQAKAYNISITGLLSTTESSPNRTFSGYDDGSTGWTKLKAALTEDDTGTPSNYPAWYYCLDYGTTNCSGTDFTSGWYLPSQKELYEIYKNKSSVEASLLAIEGTGFENYHYWSSSCTINNKDAARTVRLDNGNCDAMGKNQSNYVCAVRVFTY